MANDNQASSHEVPKSAIRNIGIMAHIDAGKTTTTERMLFYTKKIHKIGEIDDGEATMDYLSQEQERGITIQSAATSIEWDGAQINIIDTPGHVDFTAEVERSLRVLDGAVAILCAVDGVQSQTQTVWRQADSFKVPRICFVNKMDRVGADFFMAKDDITAKFNVPAVAIQVPIGQGSEFEGVIDLINMKELRWSGDNGEVITTCPISEGNKEYAAKWREQLLDTVSSFNDAITEKYLDNQEISASEIKGAIRASVLRQDYVPCLLGSSRHNIGVQPLLDAVVDYLPSPIDRNYDALHTKKNKSVGDEISLQCADNKDCAALVFKVQYNKEAGFLSYIRMYSGKITAGATVFNSTQHKRERIGRILRVNADKMTPLSQITAGDIAVIVGLKESSTGDTLCSEGFPLLLSKPIFTQPVISLSLEGENLSERKKMVEVLSILSREDPTFTSKEDTETGQILISGMGELHLDVLVTRMREDFGVNCRTGSPSVSYREGVTTQATQHCDYSKVVAGKENTAGLSVSVSPSQDTENIFEITDHNGEIPNDVLMAIEDSIRANFAAGINMGYPCVGVHFTVTKIDYNPLTATAFAFGACASEVFDKVCNLASPVVLEPVMSVDIESPANFIGDATSAIISRGGIVTGSEAKGTNEILHAQAPMAHMFGFATVLRSNTQGQASFSMAFNSYQVKAN